MNKADLTMKKKAFSVLLLKWNKEQNTREMPWKGEKDPYKIWLSEIILQQTRVEQGLVYYNNFINTFPDIDKLAKAPESTIFKLWEGLGYYTRCRNLIATARYISTELKGKFPSSYDEILALKGVGPYTAAAISSFAYNLPYAVLDGNVFRVLSRVFGIDTAIDSTEGKKMFTGLANELLELKQPGLYNQAIMDFGAMLCKPAAPLCGVCVFKKICVAFLQNKISKLPAKEKKITIRKRWFYYLVLEYNNKIAIRQRTEKDIWQDLYEFPLIEGEKVQRTRSVLEQAGKEGWLLKNNYEVIQSSALFEQKLSHQLIAGVFITLKMKKKPLFKKEVIWLTRKELKKYSFPRIINKNFILEKAGKN